MFRRTLLLPASAAEAAFQRHATVGTPVLRRHDVAGVIWGQVRRAPLRGWCADHPGGGIVARAFSSAVPAPCKHSLVSDPSQPGTDGGIKAIARLEIRSGEVVFHQAQGEVSAQTGQHTIQIGADSHCQISGEGRYTAHSFSPNMAVVVSSQVLEPLSIQFVALRTIAEGEELSIDYTATEWECESGGFVDAASGRPVRGFKYLDEAQKRYLMDAGLLPQHILRLWLGDVLARCEALERTA